MEIKEFYTLYDNVITKYIDEIILADENTKCLKLDKQKIKNIYIHYEKKRMEVRKRYMQDSTKLVDRHKIAACMMYAILKSRVFKIDRLVPNVPEHILLANEYLAFYVAVNIVEMFKRNESEYAFHENYTLYFPAAYHVNDNYKEGTFVYNTCKGMSFIKNINSFDIIAYSTIMFQLEKYTDTILLHEPPKNQ